MPKYKAKVKPPGQRYSQGTNNHSEGETNQELSEVTQIGQVVWPHDVSRSFS